MAHTFPIIKRLNRMIRFLVWGCTVRVKTKLSKPCPVLRKAQRNDRPIFFSWLENACLHYEMKFAVHYSLSPRFYTQVALKVSRIIMAYNLISMVHKL